MTNLYRVDSPINREQLNNLNLTFEDILSRFTNLQRQINILTGGEEVELILERIEETIIQAQTDIEESIRINDEALQIALNDIESQMTLINQAIESSESSTTEAVNAKNGALEATRSAIDAITEMRQLINNFNSRGTWNNATQYYKNNLVSLNGNTYIAIKDNVNKPVTDLTNWTLFAEKGIKGEKGETGAPGKDGKDGTGVNIVGSLTNESELSSSGKTGDAYLINGNLFVWNGTGWEDAGNIKGPKGDKGDPGPAGSDANVTNENIINALGYTPADNEEVTLLKFQVTNHESRLNQLEDSSNTAVADISGLSREVAYLKLQQEANERIEGGIVFADDFNGNLFGMTLKEKKDIRFFNGRATIEREIINDLILDDVLMNNDYAWKPPMGDNVVKLANGWFVAGFSNPAESGTNQTRFYVSKSEGQSWDYLGYSGEALLDMASDGNDVYALYQLGERTRFRKFNPTTVPATGAIHESSGYISSYPDLSQTVLQSASIAVSPNGTIYVASASTNNNLGTSLNIRLSTSTNKGDTWSTASQATSDNNSGTQNTNVRLIASNSSFPTMYHDRYENGSNSVRTIYLDGGNYKFNQILNGGNNTTSNLSLESDIRGYQYVVFTSGLNVYFARSTNNGASMSYLKALGQGTSPTVSVNSNNEVYVTFVNAGNVIFRKSTDGGNTFTGDNNIGPATQIKAVKNARLDFSKPFLYKTVSNTPRFYAERIERDFVDVTTGSLTYEIPKTNFVGFYLQLKGSINATALVNEVEVDLKTVNTDELKGIMRLTEEVNVVMVINLSRADTNGGNNDYLDRLLGGIA